MKYLVFTILILITAPSMAIDYDFSLISYNMRPVVEKKEDPTIIPLPDKQQKEKPQIKKSGSACPGGNCPQYRSRRGWGLFRWRR